MGTIVFAIRNAMETIDNARIMAENLSLQNFDWDAFENEAHGKQNEELVGKYDQTLYYLLIFDCAEGLIVLTNDFFVLFAMSFVLKCIPVEVLE